MKLRLALLVSLVALTFALTFAPAASAKFCVRIAVDPARPGVGVAARVLLTTLAGPGSRPTPVDRTYPMRVAATGRGRSFELELLPALGEPALWWARIRFPRPGAWTISWANWGALDSPCAPTLRVRVR